MGVGLSCPGDSGNCSCPRDNAVDFENASDTPRGKVLDTSNLLYGNSSQERRPQHVFDNGVTYNGEWVGSLRHGQGVQIWPDGAKYEGQWLSDKAQGQGRFEHVDGDVYEGSWKDDKAHGHGTYHHVDGSKYRVNGQMTSSMARVLKLGQMVQDMQDSIRLVASMDEANFFGLTTPDTMANSTRMIFMGTATILGAMVANLQVLGSGIGCMAKVFSRGATAVFMKVIIPMIRRMAMASSSGLMVGPMKGNGRKASSMAQERT